MPLDTQEAASMQPGRAAVRDLPVYFKPSQAPELFSVSDEHIYGLLAEGSLRGHKLGRATLVETRSMLEHLQANPLRLTRKPRAARKDAA